MNDEDDSRQSADDALEPRDDIFDPATDEEKLPEDNDSPAAPADDIHPAAPIDEPSTDDQMDSDELYQEGVAGATNTDDEEIGPDEQPKPLEPEDEA
ncbi:MAG TPA: hypothetical protein VK712_03745 [Verrucomicrobiae bacterium]|jgi:hypothetical protein|nr:hypothetical protein [Verrucomicrobiae bacterium]